MMKQGDLFSGFTVESEIPVPRELLDRFAAIWRPPKHGMLADRHGTSARVTGGGQLRARVEVDNMRLFTLRLLGSVWLVSSSVGELETVLRAWLEREEG